MESGAIGFTGVKTRQRIIRAVLREHGVSEESFYGKFRTPNLIEARADAARRLRDAGFGMRRISEILHRDRTTIIYYLDEKTRERKMKHLRLSRFKWMADDIKEVVLEIADAEGVNAGALVAAWIAERALYEVEARARALRTAA